MPLVRSFWLGRKPGKERYIVPIPDGTRIRFEIHGPEDEPRGRTVDKRKGSICLICNTPVTMRHLRDEGRAKRLGAQLMAIVAQGEGRRIYLPPDASHETVAGSVPHPADSPDEEISRDPKNLWCVGYGLSRFGDLFTNRQLTTLTTLSSLVRDARNRVLADCGDPAYADAVTTYLALAISRITDRHSAVTTWDSHPSKEQLRGAFPRQAIPMTWDFAEGNPFCESSGSLAGSFTFVADCLRRLPAKPSASATAADAAFGETGGRLLVATDPPYYDNISYANISDFFDVWLRRSLASVYPDLLATVLTPKDDEIIADAYRHGGAEQARRFYEERFEAAFRRICDDTPPGYPISFFYAYKQTSKERDGIVSTAWEILLSTLIKAGWVVTASWPIKTELTNRPRSQASNALNSSIVLTCRPRPPSAPVTDRRGLLANLQDEVPAAMRLLQESGIAPGDLRQAMIGPGMKVFSRHARVNEPDGKQMSVTSALKLINHIFDRELSQLTGDISTDTRAGASSGSSRTALPQVPPMRPTPCHGAQIRTQNLSAELRSSASKERP